MASQLVAVSNLRTSLAVGCIQAIDFISLLAASPPPILFLVYIYF